MFPTKPAKVLLSLTFFLTIFPQHLIFIHNHIAPANAQKNIESACLDYLSCNVMLYTVDYMKG